MGCCRSKTYSEDEDTTYKINAKAGIFLVQGVLPEPIIEEEKITEPTPAATKKGFSLFGGALATGFGKFETLFSKKAPGQNKRKFIEQTLDMTIVYHVPRNKININPFDSDLRDYNLYEKRVTVTDKNVDARYLLTEYGCSTKQVENHETE